MRNPGWRPAQESSARLAGISQHIFGPTRPPERQEDHDLGGTRPMPLSIRLATNVSPQRLRDLVVENLTPLLGEGTRVWDDMPNLHDCCIGVLDARNDLVLISFDGDDASRALVNGLSSMEALGSDLAARLLSPYRKPSRLLVLTPVPPPGAGVLEASGFIDWATFRVLSVNGEFGLLLEASGSRQRPLWTTAPPAPASPGSAQTPEVERTLEPA